MKPIEEQGYLIVAYNKKVYLDCAQLLAQSLRQWHPDVKICLLTDLDCQDSIFDFIYPFSFPVDDTIPFSFDWQVYQLTPFRQTIKLEADMYVAGPIDHYWSLFQHRDVCISVGCRDFYNKISSCRSYRATFDNNCLPDVYNAITYWRRSSCAQEFFKWVRFIFENWQSVRALLTFPDDLPSTDLVYSIAATIVGVNKVTLPVDISPKIVHMKKGIIPIKTSNWTNELVWEATNPGLRIHTVAQQGVVHYHIKEWANGKQ